MDCVKGDYLKTTGNSTTLYGLVWVGSYPSHHLFINVFYYGRGVGVDKPGHYTRLVLHVHRYKLIFYLLIFFIRI